MSRVAPCAIHVVVPASGIGRRFGGDVPKQYASLDGRAVVVRTLERLGAMPRVAGFTVVLRADDHYWDKLVLPTGLSISRVDGGAERVDSVLNGVLSLAGVATAEDWVLVHDAVRPCVGQEDLSRLVDALTGDPVGGLLAVPVRDTMKRAGPDGRVRATESREGLWHALTPQMFRYRLLAEALRDAAVGRRPVSDEAQAMELAGYSPRLVEGSGDNIKITRAADLRLATRILSAQAHSAGI